MNLASHQMPRHRKILRLGLTAILWIATVALGFLAIVALVRGIDALVLVYIFQNMQNQEMGPMTASFMSRLTNFLTMICAGVLWIGVVVFFGMSYHFKRAGQRNSYRVFAWTIGIEIALILIGNLLQTV